MTSEENKNLEKATFAAGCFWGVEEMFRTLKGVKSTAVGYTGGNFENPTYEDVCMETTGHAEALEVEFDPKEITYPQMLKFFWENHDPTTKNRQGPDRGEQYRSSVFYHNEKQKNQAEQMKAELDKSGKFKNPIVTEIVPAKAFWKAEEYHQKYLQKKGARSCHL